MKLTTAQKIHLQLALEKASFVLRELKAKPLKGKDLERMKTLESAVQALEVVSVS